MDPRAADAHLPRLTTKQRRFIEEYCVARHRKGATAGLDFNGRQAAIRAGYSPKCAAEIACENLTKPHIRQAIDERMSELSKRALMQADEVLERLSRIARSAMTEVVTLKKGLVVVADTAKWPDGFAECVQEISQGKDLQIRLKLDSRISALELLGKYHKLWTEKQEVSGLDGKPIQFALPRMEDSEDPRLPEETPANGSNHSNG